MKTKPTKPTKPRTKRQWAIYRAKLHCRVGKDAIDLITTIPANATRYEYGLYCLICAVEALAEAMEK